MFTGFIKESGIVEKIISSDSDIELTIKVSHQFGLDIKIKSHLSLDGQVFTVLNKQDKNDSFFLSFYLSNPRKAEHYELGKKVNLEKAISVGDELPGTWFYGVPSGQGKILRIKSLEGEKLAMDVTWENKMMKYLDVKDQVCIDGVLLQIKQITDSSLSFELYPETLRITNLDHKKEGNIINIEVDPIVKKISQVMERVIKKS